MTLTLFDLNHTQQNLVRLLFTQAQLRFPEIRTDFTIRLNPDNKEHILVTVFVPFYDNDREIEFSEYMAEIESDSHLETGYHISLMPHYIPARQSVEEHEPA